MLSFWSLKIKRVCVCVFMHWKRKYCFCRIDVQYKLNTKKRTNIQIADMAEIVIIVRLFQLEMAKTTPKAWMHSHLTHHVDIQKLFIELPNASTKQVQNEKQIVVTTTSPLFVFELSNCKMYCSWFLVSIFQNQKRNEFHFIQHCSVQ